MLAQPDELVVLPDDLAGALAEVERERRLVGTEVVNVEDELLRQVLGAAPDDPANAGVDEAVLQKSANLSLEFSFFLLFFFFFPSFLSSLFFSPFLFFFFLLFSLSLFFFFSFLLFSFSWTGKKKGGGGGG